MSITIERLRMVLRTQRLSAQPLQQRCSLWFHQEFRDQLERCLVHVQQELGGGSLVLDTLRLNLGDICAQRFEHDLGERAIKALARELALHVAVSRVDDAQAQGTQSELQAAAPSPEMADASFALLLAYLDTGRRHSTLLWLPPSSPSQWLHTQLDRWQTYEAAWQGRIEFAWRCLGSLSSKRLGATFNPAVLARVSRWLLATVPAATRLGLSDRQASAWLPLAAVLVLQRDTASGQAVRRRMSQERWYMADAVHLEGSPSHKQRLRRQGKSPLQGPLDALGRLLLAEPFTEASLLAIRLLLSRWTSFKHLQSEEGEYLRSMLDAAVHHGIEAEPSVGPLTHAAPANEKREDASGNRATASGKLAHPQQSLQSVRTTPLAADGLEDLVLSGAGIVLLWPLLPDLFEAHTLIDSSGFIDEAAQVQAVMLLDALVWGDSTLGLWRLEEFCYWCGFPAERILQAPDTWRTFDSGQQVQLDAWLEGVLAQIPGLDGFDAPALRALFLQRSGQLEIRDARVQLTLNTQAQDVLLRDCPWPLSHLTLPWLPLVVSLKWRAL
ncbi:contractile injection system tape measure protein [Pseudomonas sp. TE36184]